MKLTWFTLSPERKCEIIREGVAEYKSATQIAEPIFGATKNSIIGFAFRNKIKLMPSNKGGRKRGFKVHGRVVPKRGPSQFPRLVKDAVKIEPVPVLNTPAPPTSNGGMLFMERSHLQCSWLLPETDKLPAEEKRCCGMPVGESNYSFCPPHLAIVAPVIARRSPLWRDH